MKRSISFLQPDSNTCVPTSFAYLVYKLKNVDFQSLLTKIVNLCYEKYDLEKNGMEFDQLQSIVSSLGYSTTITQHKPKAVAYLTGITKLPICKFTHSQLIKTAITEGALKLDAKFFIYPHGHAISVFEKNGEVAQVYDSFLGKEREIALSELRKYLESPPSFLSLS